MTRVAVVRMYSLAFMATSALVSYQSFTTPVRTEVPPVQENLFTQVPTALPGAPPRASPAKPGEALAYLEIPRFGEEWFWAVSEGTSMDVLDNGPGHFEGSALPGERGNSAYAAHRSGHGDPFLDFDLLKVGDEITLSQNGASWTYEVTRPPTIIEPDEGWVLRSNQRGRRLTLTTCWPKYGDEKRMFIRARLESTSVSKRKPRI